MPAAALLGLLLSGFACDVAPMSPERGEILRTHELRYPLVGYANDRRSRFARSGQLERAWLHLSGSSHRALISRGHGTLRFELGDLAGGELRGTVALLPSARTRDVEHAVFEVRASLSAEDETGGAQSETLFAEQLETGASRALSLVLPARATHITLVTTHRAGDRGRSAVAAWLDPLIVKREERAPPPPGVPSLLLITADTTRADDLGVYGGPVPTPALERLAREGFLFTNAHSVAFGTTPSHASLLTGRPAALHGIHRNGGVLGESEVTLAEILRDRGYHTAAFVSAVPLSRALNLSQGFDLYDDGFIRDSRAALGGTARFERRADSAVAELLEWLDTVPPGEAFFAWAHLFDAHQPYNPRAGYAERFAGGAGSSPEHDPPAAAQALRRLGRTRIVAGELPVDALSAVERDARARYRGELAFVDEQLLRVLDALQERGEYADTLIVFVADHGENFLERSPLLAFDHAGLHSEVTRLALVIKPPRRAALVPAGRRIETLVANTDVGRTALGLLGLERESGGFGDGVDLVPWLHAAAGAPGERTAIGRPPHASIVLEGARRSEIAVRSDRWLYREAFGPTRERAGALAKLGFVGAEPVELFDLASDPDARSNVASRHPEACSRLAAITRGVHEQQGLASSELELSPEYREALEALGYLQ